MTCPNCSAQMPEGTPFCAQCGTALRAPAAPGRVVADAGATGRACPYCHTPLSAGDLANQCPHCQALHHGDCWDENGGCAVALCPGGPRAGTVSTPAAGTAAKLPAVTPAGTQAVTTTGPPPTGTQPAVTPPSGGGRGMTGLVIGAITLATVAVIAVLVLVLTQQSDDPLPVAATPTPTASPVATPASTREPEPKEIPGDPDTAGDREIEREIKKMLRRHHAAINSGDWETAYKTLSTQKRQQKRDEARQMGLADGLARYRTQFTGELEGQLRVSEMRVDLEYVGPDGEAEFKMVIPKRNGGWYCGTTWAVWEKKQWRYDLGSAGHTDRPSSGTGVLQSRSSEC